jgi:hypothetical protein
MQTDQPAVGVPVEPSVRPTPERAAFEAWFSEDGKWPAAVRRSGEGYSLAAAQSAWVAWCACGAAAQRDWARLQAALEWYADEARACAKNSHSGQHNAPEALLSSVTVLALDGGRRADEALWGPNVELSGPR